MPKMIAHLGLSKETFFIRLDENHWGLESTVGQPAWDAETGAPGWNMTGVPDEQCFLSDEFIEEFLSRDGVDPRYIRVNMALVASFTPTPVL